MYRPQERNGEEESQFGEREGEGSGWRREAAGFETLEEEGFLVGFVSEECEEEGEDGEEDEGPLGPAPGFANCYERANYRSV